MEENIGTGTHGWQSRAHASGRSKVVSKKRSRQKTNDDGEGTSSHRRSQAQPVHEPQPQNVSDDNQNVNMDVDEEEEDEGVGYPGGPKDLSLLTAYHEHMTIKIWSADERNPVVHKTQIIRTHGRKLINLEKSRRSRKYAWFWDVVDNSGLESLLHTNYNIINRGAMTAFAERWHAETTTFHVPVGETGITLDDIQCLLHLPISGQLLNHGVMDRDEGSELCAQLFGADVEEIDNWFAITGGLHLPFEYVKNIYTDSLEAVDLARRRPKPKQVVAMLRERTIRAFLLYVI